MLKFMVYRPRRESAYGNPEEQESVPSDIDADEYYELGVLTHGFCY